MSNNNNKPSNSQGFLFQDPLQLDDVQTINLSIPSQINSLNTKRNNQLMQSKYQQEDQDWLNGTLPAQSKIQKKIISQGKIQQMNINSLKEKVEQKDQGEFLKISLAPQSKLIEKKAQHQQKVQKQAEQKDQEEQLKISLAEQSKIIGKIKGNQEKLTDEIDQENFLKISLAAQSTFGGKKQHIQNKSNEKQENIDYNKTDQGKINQHNFAPSRIQKKKANKQKIKEKQKQKLQQVDIDAEIGEVAEWADRNATKNEDEEDFDSNKVEIFEETSEQLQIRKKLQQKIKNFDNSKKPSSNGMGLKAKAQQLKKQNEAKLKNNNKSSEINKNIIPFNKAQPVKVIFAAIEEQEETNISSVEQIDSIKQSDKFQERKQKQLNQVKALSNKEQGHDHEITLSKMKTDQEEEEEDDPWQKINQKTLQTYQQKKQIRKQLNTEDVLKYYKEEFKFNEKDQQKGKNHQQENQEKTEEQEAQEEVGFWESICSCFTKPKRKVSKIKEDKTNKSKSKATNLRLLALSQIQLTNTEQQFFILKSLWEGITNNKFSRYGSHWNQIGFQGRDPATDLRSTGILSLIQWYSFALSFKKYTFCDLFSRTTNKYYLWTLENGFPFALTHIKVTALFLSLIRSKDIIESSWQQYQIWYNCLSIGIFNKIMENYKSSAGIGTIVEDKIKEMKKDYKKYRQSWQKFIEEERLMK